MRLNYTAQGTKQWII